MQDMEELIEYLIILFIICISILVMVIVKKLKLFVKKNNSTHLTIEESEALERYYISVLRKK